MIKSHHKLITAAELSPDQRIFLNRGDIRSTYWRVLEVHFYQDKVNIQLAHYLNDSRRNLNLYLTESVELLEFESRTCDRCWKDVRFDERHEGCRMLSEVPVELLTREGFHKITDQAEIERIQWAHRTGTWEWMDFSAIYVNSNYTRIYGTPVDSDRTFLVCYR